MSDKIKEIESKLSTAADPKDKADLLNDLAWELRLSDPRRGLEAAGQASLISSEMAYNRGLARSICYQGVNYWYLSEFNKAITSLEQSLQMFEEISDIEGQAVSLTIMGNAYFRINDYAKSLQRQLKSLQLYKEINNLDGEARASHNIGNIYLALGDYEICLDYYIRSLNIAEQLKDDNGVALSLCCIGLVYQALGDYQKGLDYHLQSDEIFRKIGDRNGEMISVNNIGDIYFELKEYDKTVEYFQKSVKISEELGEHFVRANSLHGIGKVFHKTGKYDEALEYYLKCLATSREVCDKETEQSILLSLGQLYGQAGKEHDEFGCLQQALAIAEDLKSKPKLLESHQVLSDAYKKQNNLQKALYHFQKYHETDKEVFNDASDKKRQSALIRFQVEQKEKEAEIYRLRNVELAEANQAISQAKEIIEEKNRHITSSIEYARRIQQAVLPPAGKMQAALPEHFVLFKPRDIVSGDFYWFTQTGGKILIAVVDCTGHGVPGAFMSMIGSMLLNTIVNENGETDPANVLAQLHVAVRSALKQHDAEADTTDGMDVCLCAIDLKEKRLVYAGAKRSLYLVRGTELAEIAGDSKSIGGRQKEEKRAFSDKQIELQKRDMFYLTSDGYADQCDAEGRKIGSRRLKDLLVQISGQDPIAQQATLLTELANHQGEEEQRDDIAILGIRL